MAGSAVTERREMVVVGGGQSGLALLGWVKDDAEYLAQRTNAVRPSSPAEAAARERIANAARSPRGGRTAALNDRRAT